MQSQLEFSAVITKDGKWYVALCPELDVASQGKSIEEALKNLKEAVELYFEDEDAKIPEAGHRPIVTIVRVALNEKASSRIRA